MKFASSLVLAALASLQMVCGHTMEFNMDSFDKEIKSGNWLIMYFSPTCKYSKAMKTPWDNATHETGDYAKSNKYHFATVDCKAQQSLCTSQKIDGYPTLFVYNAGQVKEEYLGAADAQELSNYVKASSDKYAQKQ